MSQQEEHIKTESSIDPTQYPPWFFEKVLDG